MNKKKPISLKKTPYVPIYLILGIIFITFVLLDFFFPYSNRLSSGLKLSSIILLFFAQLIWGKEGTTWWKGAAGLTILTDYFLLFTHFYARGIFFFIPVHLFRYLNRKQEKRTHRLLFLGLLAVGLYFVFHLFLPRLMALALVYTAFLFLNTVEAFRSKNKRLSWAYCLFLACDICVAMANVSGSASSAALAGKLIWIFYLPSQVFLADEIMDAPMFF